VSAASTEPARKGLTRAVLLAAGRGTRMSAAAPLPLDSAASEMAARGLKPLIPFAGEPFIAYTLTTLADAGFADVCVVVPPGDSPVRAWITAARTTRLRLHVAVQEAPLGTAHALLAAEPFADGRDIALVNADNDYPVAALTALRSLSGPGLVGFSRAGLLRGNITSERLQGYALVDVDDAGCLCNIIEKPSAGQIRTMGDAALFSMTCWRFGPDIFEACRSIRPSMRGELELPDAVRSSMEAGTRYEVVTVDAPVLDLSRPDDINAVARSLRGRDVAI
jgi:dTDP-glucose pyrophosphorylase